MNAYWYAEVTALHCPNANNQMAKKRGAVSVNWMNALGLVGLEEAKEIMTKANGDPNKVCHLQK